MGGEKLSSSYTYKGLVIYKNEKGAKFNTPYFTVVNPRKTKSNGRLLHCHCRTENSARKVIECFNRIMYSGYVAKYSLNIRNKALMLMNERVVV